MLTLSTQNLSADGTRPSSEERAKKISVTADAVLATLRAFAAVPPVQLAGIDARIYLSGPQEKIAVQNAAGRLLVARVPETINTWEECTPEETLARLTSGAATETSQATLLVATGGDWLDRLGRPSRVRKLLGSPWIAIAVALVAAVMVWRSFSPDLPEGVTPIREAARIGQLNAQLNGRYETDAAAGQTILELGDGQCRGFRSEPGGQAKTTLFAAAYRYGLRDGNVVLLVENGAVLEVQPDGRLKFLDAVYARRPG